MTDRIKGVVIGALFALLALSLIGNFFLYHGYTGQIKKTATAEANLKTANDNTDTCNKSIESYEDAAYAQGLEAAAKRAAAKDRKQQLELQAQQILATPDSAPGDECKSGIDAGREWLSSRKRK